jgi:hypothetical protein
VVGNNSYGIVKYCYATGNVSGRENVGGVVGENTRSAENNGLVENCYAISNVNGYKNVGGVAGTNLGTVINCYAQGDVSGEESVGGVVGRNSSRMENCYATGSVSGNENVGGVAGINSFTTSIMRNCVALNKQITRKSENSSTNYGRVIGNDSGTSTNNHGRDDMALPDGITPGSGGKNGSDVATTTVVSATWWTGTAQWSTTAWNIANGSLPTLQNMPGNPTQNPVVKP